ncbi:MAG TPA: acyltransferase domain-containing protein, partial [Candidatus Polarisedimenticolia bacterium]|nr:acyltransferase domain-containing protein [Candidatus Polarisedimenticolia bacterium]
MLAGHSYGEYVALCAAGVFDAETLALLSNARGRSILEAARQDLGTMAAVPEGAERVAEILKSVAETWIANLNAPRQTVISGTREGIRQAVERLKGQGVEARSLPVACAFHSPVIAPARDRLAAVLAQVEFEAPRIEVYANASAAPYPRDPQALVALLADHLVSPVRFADEVEAMHRAGARLFVEAGPKNVLTGLAQQILGERPHLAVASDVPGRPGLTQIQHLLGQLAAHGVAIDLDRLFEGREVRELNLADLQIDVRATPLSPTTWLVNGGSARPINQPRSVDATVERPTAPGAGVAREAPVPVAPASSGARQPADDVRLPPATPPPADDPSTQIIVQFQQLMNRFLDTQKTVMQAYFAGRSADGVGPAAGLAAPAPDLEAAAAPSPEPGGGDALLPTPAPVSEVDGPRSCPVAPGDDLTPRLLAIVGDRTGYPPEMIDLDLNIEADLGIDSIKRVEILGAFQRVCPRKVQERLQGAMESLTRMKTLRGILTLATEGTPVVAPRPGVRAPGTPIDAEAASTSGPATDDFAEPVPRFLCHAVEAPSPVPGPSPVADRLLLVTDDETGLAEAFADLIVARGARVARVRHGGPTAETGAGLYTADLTDEAGVEELVELVRRRQGAVAGLIHLLPARPVDAALHAPFDDWRPRLARDVKSLFHLARALHRDLV